MRHVLFIVSIATTIMALLLTNNNNNNSPAFFVSAQSPAVVTTTYTERGDCAGQSTTSTFVQDQCVVSTASGATTYTTYKCNATYVKVNTWNGKDCTGTASVDEIPLDNCIISTSTASTKFECSNGSCGKVLSGIVVGVLVMIISLI